MALLRTGSAAAKGVRGALVVLVAFASSTALAHYLRWEPEPAVRTVAFLLLFLSLWKMPVSSWRDVFSRREFVGFGLFSVALSLSIVFGYHIVITAGYDGLMADNYITPYSWIDPLAFLLVFTGVSILSLRLFALIKGKRAQAERESAEPVDGPIDQLGWKWIVGLAGIAFIVWIPYLLAYWPGFVFGDTISSIYQALDSQLWKNNFPFAHTAFIEVCFVVACTFGGDITVGCAIYSVLQMAIMAVCFGYLCRWAVVRAHVANVWGIVIVVGMAASPYIATYSIAMWKDPLFSVGMVFATMLLFDFALTRGRIVRESRAWTPLFVGALLMVTLLRSNGIYVALALLIVLGTSYLILRRRDRAQTGRPFVLCAATIIVSLCLTGPVYTALGVFPADRVEGVGTFLNQMARVAALDGDMTEADRAYMNELLPVERYADTYRPGCVDMLKWDPDFNEAPLEEDFFSHWLSLGLRNPRVYFEAWELQTCGFWAVGLPAVNDEGNIERGTPRNLHPEYDGAGVGYENKLGSDRFRSIFPSDEWAIPASWLNWCVLYLALCLGLLHRGRWVLSLVPTFALIATLLIASPIWYWSRYEAAVYFLIPFYAAVAVMLMKGVRAQAGAPNEGDKVS